MRPHERGAGRAVTRPAPVEHPQATVTKSRGVSHSTRQTAHGHAVASRVIPAALFFAALGCFIFAVGDVHASPMRAAIAVVAGAALWITGEAVSR